MPKGKGMLIWQCTIRLPLRYNTNADIVFCQTRGSVRDNRTATLGRWHFFAITNDRITAFLLAGIGRALLSWKLFMLLKFTVPIIYNVGHLKTLFHLPLSGPQNTLLLMPNNLAS